VAGYYTLSCILSYHTPGCNELFHSCV
jgi:hypothetical protein